MSIRERWGGRAVVLGGYALAAVVLFGAAPALLSDFRLRLLAQFLCVAMVAVGIGLAWGSGGMLTLGQGVFFGLGAYIMAIHLQLADAGPGGRPAFMITGDALPWWWELFRSPVTAVLGIVAVSNQAAHVDQQLARVLEQIEATRLDAQVVDQQIEIIPF